MVRIKGGFYGLVYLEKMPSVAASRGPAPRREDAHLPEGVQSAVCSDVSEDANCEAGAWKGVPLQKLLWNVQKAADGPNLENVHRACAQKPATLDNTE